MLRRAKIRFGYEFDLKGYCLEAERAINGNPLVFDKGSWSLEQCVAESAKQVLKDNWKGSQDIASEVLHKDTHYNKDPRAIARKALSMRE